MKAYKVVAPTWGRLMSLTAALTYAPGLTTKGNNYEKGSFLFVFLLKEDAVRWALKFGRRHKQARPLEVWECEAEGISFHVPIPVPEASVGGSTWEAHYAGMWETNGTTWPGGTFLAQEVTFKKCVSLVEDQT